MKIIALLATRKMFGEHGWERHANSDTELRPRSAPSHHSSFSHKPLYQPQVFSQWLLWQGNQMQKDQKTARGWRGPQLKLSIGNTQCAHLTSGENTTELQKFTGLLCRLNEKRCVWSLAPRSLPLMAAVMVMTMMIMVMI